MTAFPTPRHRDRHASYWKYVQVFSCRKHRKIALRMPFVNRRMKEPDPINYTFGDTFDRWSWRIFMHADYKSKRETNIARFRDIVQQRKKHKAVNSYMRYRYEKEIIA